MERKLVVNLYGAKHFQMVFPAKLPIEIKNILKNIQIRIMILYMTDYNSLKLKVISNRLRFANLNNLKFYREGVFRKFYCLIKLI